LLDGSGEWKVAPQDLSLAFFLLLPGIYIFRDGTGYLYIGEAGNLRGRVEKHLDHSDRKALAHYLWNNGYKNLWVELHAFRKDSDGDKAAARKAYEADLIRSHGGAPGAGRGKGKNRPRSARASARRRRSYSISTQRGDSGRSGSHGVVSAATGREWFPARELGTPLRSGFLHPLDPAGRRLWPSHGVSSPA
jgi:hypothetical protein